jgi:hypothetical protein
MGDCTLPLEFYIYCDWDTRRYLTKLCDQTICLLSAEHSQAIAWDDEHDDDALTDLDIDDSGRLYDFVVAKKNDQEENVVARPGFLVPFSPRVNYSLTLTSLLSQDELPAPCQ